VSLNNWQTIQGDAVTFGPVPSRRLRQSLGINNIPPKICSYACIYCQLGRTLTMQTERTGFFEPERILEEVQKRVEEVRDAGESIDYLSFVPDGEPTLDLRLGREIELLRPLGIRIAVITNASLIWREEVRDELAGADWVSLKVDSVREDVWRRIDRPHGHLRLSQILDGALAFSESFAGRLVTETMLVEGVNDSGELLEELSEFLARLRPETAYLAIPTRPPAEEYVRAPDESGVTRAWQILSGVLDNVECLAGYEGDTFFSGGRVDEDLLAITSVHPMRVDAVDALLTRRGADQSVVKKLVDEGKLIEVEYGGQGFLVRKLARPRATGGKEA
jgi:wyosine [tRNA(Phe)-imidazoG37] synthetase (radical SAM superfamily)